MNSIATVDPQYVCLLEGKTNAKIHRIFILQIIYKRAMFEIVDEILIR